MNDEQMETVEVLGPGPGAGDASMNNLRVREMDGDRLFEAEGVESMVTHLLNEWRMRADARRTADADVRGREQERLIDVIAAGRRGAEVSDEDGLARH